MRRWRFYWIFFSGTRQSRRKTRKPSFRFHWKIWISLDCLALSSCSQSQLQFFQRIWCIHNEWHFWHNVWRNGTRKTRKLFFSLKKNLGVGSSWNSNRRFRFETNNVYWMISINWICIEIYIHLVGKQEELKCFLRVCGCECLCLTLYIGIRAPNKHTIHMKH